MRTGLIAMALVGMLLSFSSNARAQVYDLYYYWDGTQYQQYWPQYDLYYSYGDINQYPEQEYDPYYQLHVLHYRLYLPQAYTYVPCCFVGGVIVPARHRAIIPTNVISPPPSPISPLPRFITQPPQLFRQR